MTSQDVSAPKAQGYDWWSIGKDMIGTAIVAMLIMWPIVAWKSEITQYSLEIVPRWKPVFIILALLLATRLAMHLFVWNRAPSPVAAAAKPAGPAKATLSEQIGPWVFPVLVAFAVALPFIFHFERRPIDLGIYILTYVMLAWGLNIVVGLAGLLDLGYVAFYAVGAYAYALLSTVYFPYWFGDGIVPWAFYITLPVAGLLAALWGVILGFPVLRLRGDYLAIVTLAFGEIIRLVLINWFSFTNGPQGIEVPKATFFGLPFKAGPGGFADFFGIQHNRIYYYIFLYYVILLLALLTYFVTNRLRRLPIGRAWEALREDEIACRSLGINTTNTKLTAFATGAMFGGFAGCFFATRQGFVSPESFVFIESAIILAIVVLGGLGSQLGIAFAAIVVMGAFEVFRELGAFFDGLNWLMKLILPDAFVDGLFAAVGDFLSWISDHLPSGISGSMSGIDPVHFRMLAVGLAMVLMMRFRPRGFVTRRQPTVFLKQRKAVSGDLVKEGHG